jgi:ribosome-associated protein
MVWNAFPMNERLSKSERKRRAKGVEQLVGELAALPPGEIASLPCAADVREAILAARDLKGGARKRQLKYATKLLRDALLDDLYDLLANRKGSALKENRTLQRLEHLRNSLVSEAIRLYDEAMQTDGYLHETEPVDFLAGAKTLEAVARDLPGVDLFLLKNTAAQYARTRNRKFSRELFRIMRAAMEKAQYAQLRNKDNGV